MLLYPQFNKVEKGVYWFHLVRLHPSVLLLEDQLYYWKINCDVGRLLILSEDQPCWRQSTGIDGNYWSRKITARRWLHKYVGAEWGACFTWYLNQICLQMSVCPSVDRIVSALYLQQYSPDPFHICTSYQATSGVSRVNLKFWQIL